MPSALWINELDLFFALDLVFLLVAQSSQGVSTFRARELNFMLTFDESATVPNWPLMSENTIEENIDIVFQISFKNSDNLD